MRRAILIIILIAQAGLDNHLISQCSPSQSKEYLEINKVRALIPNAGMLWMEGNESSYEIPKGSGVHSIHSGGLWIGGIDAGGKLHMAAQTYRQTGTDFWPGPINNLTGEVSVSECMEWDRHWKVNKTDIELFLSLSFPVNTSSIPKSILEWPALKNPYAKGNNNIHLIIDQYVAPFIDTDGKPGYDPTQGDYPAICGNQAIFWVFNDVGNSHGETGGEKIGLEVKMMAYAYATTQAYLDQVTFYRFEMTHKGDNDLDSVYFGHQVDADLGYAFDDYIGCDPAKNLAFTYNADGDDGPSVASYFINPPVLGIRLLESPGPDLGMTHFRHYNNDYSIIGNPETAQHYYYYLKGKWKNGSQMNGCIAHGCFGGGGFPINFMNPGIPGAGGCDECSLGNSPGDRKMLISSGPFRFNKGETKYAEFAAIWHRPTVQIGCMADISELQVISDVVQALHDNQSVCSIPTGIGSTKDSKRLDWEIYPNPTNNYINIDLGKDIKPQSLRLMDYSGKVIEEINLESRSLIRIPVSQFPSGMYQIELQDQDGRTGIKKVVVINN